MFHLLTNTAPTEARQRFLEAESERLVSNYNEAISPRTENAIAKAMRIHPDERLQSVQEFRAYLLGDWNPKENPRGLMPAPNLWELLRATEEQLLAWIAILVFVVSIVATLTR